MSEGNGIRFDIGFIGVGNTEISLDKVSRFHRVDEIVGRAFDMSTIVIVDRIGEGSRIQELASAIDGIILQMSSALWAKTLDHILAERFPDDHSAAFPANANASVIRNAVFARLEEADLQHLLANVEA